MHVAAKIELVPVAKLQGYARNTRTHSDSQIEKLVGSIREFGFTVPLIITDDDTILAGHGRLVAAQRAGMLKVPCIRAGYMTEAQKRAYVIADNRLAEDAGWDKELLGEELKSLSELGFDVATIGFTEAEVTFNIDLALNSPGLMNEVRGVDDDERTQVKVFQDVVDFPFEGKWELPKLHTSREHLLEIPDSISLWTYKRISADFPPPYLYNYRMDSTVGLDWHKAIVAFYTDDTKFQGVWDDTAGSVREMLKNGVMGAVMPNFTTAPDMSTTVRAFNTYRSRYVARYMQDSGIKIIPDVNCYWFQPEFEVVVEGLKGMHTLAFQHQQVLTGKQRVRCAEAMAYVMDEVKPETVLVYAPDEVMLHYPALSRARVVRVDPNLRVKKQYKRDLDKRDKLSQ